MPRKSRRAQLLEQADAFVFTADAEQVAGVVVGGDRLFPWEGEGRRNEIDFQHLSRENSTNSMCATTSFSALFMAGSAWNSLVIILAAHDASSLPLGRQIFV